MLRAYANQFNITKLQDVVSGGKSAQESIRNGVFHLEAKAKADDIIIIHDGIRPLVDDTVLSDVIQKARQYGNGVTSLPYNEQIFIVNPDDETTTRQYIPRETLRRVSTPQAYQFGRLDSAYHEAFEKGIGIYGSSYTNTMMVELGETLHFAAGSDKNIKLTTKDDLEKNTQQTASSVSGGSETDLPDQGYGESVWQTFPHHWGNGIDRCLSD